MGQQLHYEPEPLQRAHRRRRRTLRWGLIALIVLGTIAIAPAVYHRTRYILAERRAMAWTDPLGTVVWDFGTPTQVRPRPLSFMNQLQLINDNVVFVHERISPAGQRRLVSVSLWRATGRLHLQLLSTVTAPLPVLGRSSPPLTRGGEQVLARKHLRLYAGQIDPADPSHFTIDADVDGERITYDGWLRDDDTVLLEPRPPVPIPPPSSSPALSP